MKIRKRYAIFFIKCRATGCRAYTYHSAVDADDVVFTLLKLIIMPFRG